MHAAGFADRRGFAKLPREGLERAFAVMAAAFHELATAAMPDIARDKAGRVVAISSFGAHRFVPDGTFPASASAKAALEVLVKSLAIELAPSGATANIVVPGYTRKDPGLFGALDAKAGKRSRRPIRRHGWPSRMKWPPWSRSCCRRMPAMSPARCCRSMAD